MNSVTDKNKYKWIHTVFYIYKLMFFIYTLWKCKSEFSDGLINICLPLYTKPKMFIPFEPSESWILKEEFIFSLVKLYKEFTNFHKLWYH